MKKTIIALAAVSCMLTACATFDTPRHQIEKHLGVSTHGKRILDEYMFGLTEGAPDMTLVRHELLKHDDMRNLTVGLLMIPWTDELDAETINTNMRPDDLKQVLDANLSRSGSTLVRPEDVTNFTTQTDAKGRIIGTFDWVVPNLFRGRARFVARGDKIEYLGILRKNPVSTYDSETIFYRQSDILTSEQLIRTKYFAAIEPQGENSQSLKREEQIKAIQELIRANRQRGFPLPAHIQKLPIAFWFDTLEDRNKVISILKNSGDWSVTMSGRAIDHPPEEPFHKSITSQIKDGQHPPGECLLRVNNKS